MKKVLFINQKNVVCGVYQYGLKIFNILKASSPDIKSASPSSNIVYTHVKIDTLEEYTEAIKDDYVWIVYNYYPSNMKWLTPETIQKKVRNVGITHETTQLNLFDFTLNIDPTEPETETNISLPRPILENVPTVDYSTPEIKEFCEFSEGGPNIPIFGSMGFGCANKRFHEIVKLINENYDRAIIKLVMVYVHGLTCEMVRLCHVENVKVGIKLMITHEFFTTEDLVKFLNSNTANIFLYQPTGDIKGPASVIDYAISARKPVVISDCNMFSHVYEDGICINKTTLSEILDQNGDWWKKWHDLYSNKKMVRKFLEIDGRINEAELKIPNIEYTNRLSLTEKREFLCRNSYSLPMKALKTFDMLCEPSDKDDFFMYAFLYLKGGFFMRTRANATVNVKYLIRPEDTYIDNPPLTASIKGGKEVLFKIREMISSFQNRDGKFKCFLCIQEMKNFVVYVHDYGVFPDIFCFSERSEGDERSENSENVYVRRSDDHPWGLHLVVDVLNLRNNEYKKIEVGSCLGAIDGKFEKLVC